jgi:hypothetical protein
MNWRFTFLFALTVFAITLAVIIGGRLSSETVSILLGVVIGVAASLPANLIIVWAIKRNQQPPPEPRIMIVPPTANATPQPSLPAGPETWNAPRPAPAPDARPRQFVVIGGDEPADE